MNLSNWPVIIDQPGHYVLTRNWDLEAPSPNDDPAIKIVADGVTLDFRGFYIRWGDDEPIVRIESAWVTMRNGSVGSSGDGDAIVSTGKSTLIDLMAVGGRSPISLSGENSVVSKTTIVGHVGVHLEGTGSRLEWSDVTCESFCVTAGDRTEVRDNRIVGQQPDPWIRVVGSAALVANNVISGRYAAGSTVIEAEGDRNVIRANTLRGGRGVESWIAIGLLGSGNVADGNIAEPHESTRWAEGVRFGADGNFYGDNRMAAVVPFNVGGTVQSDWGGNVGY